MWNINTHIDQVNNKMNLTMHMMSMMKCNITISTNETLDMITMQTWMANAIHKRKRHSNATNNNTKATKRSQP